MASSIIGHITIPTLSRFEPAASSSAAATRPAEDIAMKDIKRPDITAAAVEAQEDPAFSTSREAVGRDPLELRGKILNDGELNELRQRKKSGKITQFYEDQNDVHPFHIERLLKPMHVLTSEAQAEEQDAAGAVKLAIRLSFIANILLAGLQLYAAISSLSLSLFATCIDAVFDPFANVLLNILHKRSKNVDEKKWPIGGSRFESSESGRLWNVMVVTFIDAYSDLWFQLLYEDHRNDCFVNAFGIGMSAAGAKVAWWVSHWQGVAEPALDEQFQFLAGIAAPVDFQQLVIYKVRG
ncbi:hypothetical protein QFC19_001189 [Naganishia cerealis]|uniref:Uncharacterized protein n=1 Tax=Naganishia cerealis TaxID=610337 RepID=A0ACC2WJR6_9TREE|nr:hypothetical protein QFC19_001189 [Naganishia cerealis]